MPIAMGIQYTGTGYRGWQQQKKPCVPTVQVCLQNALNRLAPQTCPIEVICAGRTDAGVHALAQVIHFNSSIKRDKRAWLLGTNAYLPHDIRVTWVHEVDQTFHARYSALARAYRYVIYNQPVHSALWADKTAAYYQPLDVSAMQQAANYLIGEHDFSSFRAAQCQAKSPKRHVHAISIHQKKPYIVIDIQANAFLYHMVRNIVGVLMTIGSGIRPIGAMLDILQACDRRQACKTAPASGLYLMKVIYPKQFNLPKTIDYVPF